MIYTSNFSKLNHSLDSGASIFQGREWVGIVRIPPKDVHPDITFNTVIAPSRKLLKQIKAKEITEEQYHQAYIRQLNQIGVNNIIKLYDNKVLLCYCGEHSFCHRHILREWLANQGIQSLEI